MELASAMLLTNLLSILFISSVLGVNRENFDVKVKSETKIVLPIPIHRVNVNHLKSKFQKQRKPIKIKLDQSDYIYSPDYYGLSLRNEENFDVSKYLNKY